MKMIQSYKQLPIGKYQEMVRVCDDDKLSAVDRNIELLSILSDKPVDEIMDMPIAASGEVDDTCIVLEYNDNAESLAEFFLGEWERISKEYKEM